MHASICKFLEQAHDINDPQRFAYDVLEVIESGHILSRSDSAKSTSKASQVGFERASAFYLASKLGFHDNPVNLR